MTPSSPMPEPRETPTMSEPRKVVAYQLSLLGEEPRPGHAWQRPFYAWNFCGIPFPLSEDEERQNRMLRPDTMPPKVQP